VRFRCQPRGGTDVFMEVEVYPRLSECGLLEVSRDLRGEQVFLHRDLNYDLRLLRFWA